MPRKIKNSKRREIAIYHLQHKGSVKNTAEKFDVSPTTVSRIVKELLKRTGHNINNLYVFSFSKTKEELQEIVQEIQNLE